MQEIQKELINLVSGGMVISNPSRLTFEECQYVSADGKCEDTFTTPPTIPRVELPFS